MLECRKQKSLIRPFNANIFFRRAKTLFMSFEEILLKVLCVKVNIGQSKNYPSMTTWLLQLVQATFTGWRASIHHNDKAETSDRRDVWPQNIWLSKQWKSYFARPIRNNV